MAPRKGFPPFTRVVNPELLSSAKNWYVLSKTVCGMSPNQYFKRSAVVLNFPEEFLQVEIGSLRLANGDRYDGKVSSEVETVASSLGLLAVVLRQNQDKSSLQKEEGLIRVKALVNSLDFSSISTEDGIHEASNDRPRAAHRLAMPSTPLPDASDEKTTGGISSPFSMLKTPSSSGIKGGSFVKGSPNLKEISENSDLDTPEKTLMVEKRAKTVISNINDVCSKHRESLSTVLSYMCAFGDEDAKAVLNDVIEQVSVRKGVKRAVEDLVGEETYAKYVESLRVPDWVLLYFKTKGRISGNTWQAVIYITKLGRTGVSSETLFFGVHTLSSTKKPV